ncbi:non-hydrolyzing UDP-N-acetylglucosamine 2-epimerase [Nitrosopumilus piranensis]|uniref:UDP-N-acetylglucosamine 2-epimerase n=1 Tax=Nitrosopumilus piranensis TaxID=1582439 RepID=A0A0C5BWG7_9ARCH|nr:UDP-N-acetylglucosamine 2-epimerase (non-hydrolyzing) [Nitrosopumilus piranensis]AJM91320.1 UDP-N-acetylglucosamine 2-epimerase [Nitrosopumilus piranensis]
MKKILLVTGTRPEIIKLAPIIKKIKNDMIFVHTGQHYDYNMSLQFIEELELPSPDFKFKLTKREPTLQISQIIKKINDVIKKINPAILCVQGDTNTVLGSSLAALKNKIPIAHVESGLRSHDWRMQEEHNRIMVDHISDLLFAATANAKKSLINENVHGKIFVTGNTVIDAIENYLPTSLKKSKIETPSEFILTTLHRAENIDNAKTLSNLCNAIIKSPIPIIFPIHPRTKSNLKKLNLYDLLKKSKNVTLISPVGYFDFLYLMKSCKFIITDSGGIQEEVTSPSIKKFALVVRKTTDRPESVKSKFAKVIGTNKENIISEIHKTNNSKLKLPRNSPYGDGHSSDQILSLIYQYLN